MDDLIKKQMKDELICDMQKIKKMYLSKAADYEQADWKKYYTRAGRGDGMDGISWKEHIRSDEEVVECKKRAAFQMSRYKTMAKHIDTIIEQHISAL